MNLTPREKDKLLIAMAATVARRRLERGVKLNHPEAIALITDFVVEGARDGRLIFADATRLDGDITGLLARSAVAGGARALALLLYIAPDAPDCLDAVRGALSSARSNCAASAWNGMLTARFLGADANECGQCRSGRDI